MKERQAEDRQGRSSQAGSIVRHEPTSHVDPSLSRSPSMAFLDRLTHHFGCATDGDQKSHSLSPRPSGHPLARRTLRMDGQVNRGTQTHDAVGDGDSVGGLVAI